MLCAADADADADGPKWWLRRPAIPAENAECCAGAIHTPNLVFLSAAITSKATAMT